MEKKHSLRCPICLETRGSRRALRKHMVWHREEDDDRTLPGHRVRRVVLHEAHAVSPGAVTSKCDPRVATKLPSSIPVENHRRLSDAAVRVLKKRHGSDRTALSSPTDELARWLETSIPGIPFPVCVGIVVAAKHFAGTRSPRQHGTRPTRKQRDQISPTRSTVRRNLFSDKASTTEPTVTARNPGGRRSEEAWRLDIWRSYGSREVQPPSPFGCQISPSRVFDGTSTPPATSPPDIWSPSSNDEPWGPDSPLCPLQEDDHQDVVPGWPILMTTSGLKLNNSERRIRLQRWREERTAGVQRAGPKRRHHLRSRRRSRERYASAMATTPALQLRWSSGEGTYRPLSLSDVQLPSPPPYLSALLRTRRIMTMARALPAGCRLRPRMTRRTAQRNSTPQNTVAKKACRGQRLSPDIILDAPEDETL